MKSRCIYCKKIVPDGYMECRECSAALSKTLMAGKKNDQEKSRLDLIPPEFINATGDILTSGATKYGERNWEQGMAWHRPYGALLRHLNAWWSGESKDPETGKSHLWHAACNVAFLIAYEARGIGEDDRPKTITHEDTQDA